MEENLKKSKLKVSTSKEFMNLRRAENIFCQMARSLGEKYLKEEENARKAMQKKSRKEEEEKKEKNEIRSKLPISRRETSWARQSKKINNEVKLNDEEEEERKSNGTVGMENIPFGDELDGEEDEELKKAERADEEEDEEEKEEETGNLVVESTLQSVKSTNKTLSKPAKRTTLREEIVMNELFQFKVPDYYTRKSYDLMRIVEDQVSVQV